LVGGLIVAESDEVIAIKTSGQIIRASVSDVAVKGRDTMGVKFVGLRGEDQVAAIALYPEDRADESAPADAPSGDEPVSDEASPA
jgi:DNA gyrase subunit A